MEIQVVKNVLDANLAVANQSREKFRRHGVFVVNVMSSPGSGKTTLLEKTLTRLASELRAGIIVGDVSTTHDAERLARSGVPVVQVNTDAFGGDCHLAAHVIAGALDSFDLSRLDLLIIENVGNLVCPAEFDIGEDAKAVVLSVTEGEDKPVKYPLMFRVCDVAVLNKIDLLPYLEYDRDAAVAYIHQVHDGMPIFELSAKTEQGMEAWLGWLREQVARKRSM
uniref:Hydrogenase accessory protein HypB n=1 Tax=Desulfatirhabdium butyrativorans TaxID=340467 RepID=A0A7C4MMS0_9BACT